MDNNITHILSFFNSIKCPEDKDIKYAFGIPGKKYTSYWYANWLSL